jgi:hypothetical protein
MTDTLSIAARKYIAWDEADRAAETECVRLRASVVHLEDVLDTYVEEHDLDFDEVRVRAAELRKGCRG